jgi:Ran GTPase-activating protein (RanGAP) involved in mRNA processing and transport
LEFNVLSITLGNLKTLSSVTLIGADLSTHDFIESSFAQLTCLTEMIVRNCKLNDLNGAKMIRAIKPNTKLTKVSLAQNLVGKRTCDAIAEILCDPWIKWQDLDLSWNHIQGASPILMLGCLAKSYTVQSIHLSWNGMRHETSMFAFCNALATSDCVKFADLSNCEISDYGALLIADLLRKARSLTELNLHQNPIRTFGCRSILRTLGLRQKSNPDLQSIRVLLPVEERSVMESAFDIESLTGKIKLDLSLPSHRHILKAIFKRKMEGSAIITGAVQFKGIPCQFEKVMEECQKLEQNALNRAAEDAERVWTGAQEPEPEPEVIQVAREVEPVLFIPGQTDEEDQEEESEDGVSADLPTEDGDADEDSAASDHGKSGHLGSELNQNILTFALMTIRSKSSLDNVVTPFELDYFVRLLQSMDLSVPGTASRQYDAVRLLFSGSNVLKTADIIKILNEVCDDYRMLATKISLTRCLESSGMEQILENLSQTEYKSLSKLVSGSIMKFTPNNPTGHYSLRLSEQLDRDFFFRLIDVKTMQDEMLKSDPVWQSYRYINMERNFLNTSLDGRPLTIDRSLVVPLNGNLTFDFVSHIPPSPDQYAVVSEKHVLEFVIGPQDENEKLDIFRRWSNVNIFTVNQAVRLLSVFSGDENRVEFCVIVFNRLLDWHGRLRLYHLLSISAMRMLTSRIGYQNMWDDVVAVQYHEYDLSIAAERFCVGRLVDLAVIEPGENMCYEHFNEREFQCPASWANDDVPKKGLFSVYYCRSDRVIAGIVSRSPAQSIPPNFLLLQPSGQEWVELHKRNRLRRMIRDKFPDPERAFLVMDESGDGSLSRKEFARGLRILGIEMKAHELANLMELLDEDGGGEIDSEEFVAFVNAND